jgi:hypothetical protein
VSAETYFALLISSLNAYSHLVVSGKVDSKVSFPLCCLVDYRGFR